jgi:hypothetical protein
MKMFRSILAASALLLAVGGAFASNLLFTYYRYSPTAPAACVATSYSFECITAVNENPCTILFEGDQEPLRQNDIVANQCGSVLFKKP